MPAVSPPNPHPTPTPQMEEPSKPSNATFAGGAVRQAPPQDLDVSMADARVSPPRLPGGGFVAAPAAPPSQAHAFRAPTPQPDVVSAPAPSAPAPTAQWPQRPVPVEVSAAAAHLRRMSELPPTPMLGNRGGDAQMQVRWLSSASRCGLVCTIAVLPVNRNQRYCLDAV